LLLLAGLLAAALLLLTGLLTRVLVLLTRVLVHLTHRGISVVETVAPINGKSRRWLQRNSGSDAIIGRQSHVRTVAPEPLRKN
jgi:hypothetical protein